MSRSNQRKQPILHGGHKTNEERYPSFSSFYYAAAAVNGLVAQRYLLPDDGVREFRNALSDVLQNGLLPKDTLAEKLLARKELVIDTGMEDTGTVGSGGPRHDVQ